MELLSIHFAGKAIHGGEFVIGVTYLNDCLQLLHQSVLLYQVKALSNEEG
jgi:hypothetical protein